MKKNVGIIGAGPGGLATGVLLKHQGFDVDIFEIQNQVGGRNAKISMGDYHFDVGPTFFLMPQVLEEIFHTVGKPVSEYIDLRQIEPLYRLDFGEGAELRPSSDFEKTKKDISKLSAHDAANLEKFFELQEKKFRHIGPLLQKPLMSLKDAASIGMNMLSAFPYLLKGSVYDELAEHFEDDRVRLAFTFQSKYLGMSPFQCPSLFSILSHIEHSFGVWHPIGGCNQISKGLAKLFVEMGGNLHLEHRIVNCNVDQRKITDLEIENKDGIKKKEFDYVVMNADFAHGMKNLFKKDVRRKYTDEKISKMKFSCSTFMIYAGLDTVLPLDHHGIYFSKNYKKNLQQITETHELPEDPSFYIHNPSKIDHTLAPSGKSALYILVPVPNLDSKTNWNIEKDIYKNKILDLIESRTKIDIRKHMLCSRVVTPLDWQNEFKVMKGATFSFTHSLDQISYFRPHNKSEDFSNLFITGGGTHPGSGLPTIFQSSLIASDLITQHRAKHAPSKSRQFQFWGARERA
jgi:phytoene desaturase